MNQIDLTKPIYLNFDQKKFWEISLQNGSKTQIRYGKLVQGAEVAESIQTVDKQHKDTDSCLAYILRVMDVKRLKGYQGDIVTKSAPQVVIPSNNSTGFSIQVSAPKAEDEEKTDKNTQAYLALNSSWNQKFHIITVKGKDVEEVTGQINLKKTWKLEKTSLTSASLSLAYFSEKIEELEHSGYIRDDQQYNFQLKECNKHLISNLADQTLAIPNKKKPVQKENSRKKMDDSHSNISDASDVSDISDLTDRSRGSQMDLSFDQGDGDDVDGDGDNSQNIDITGYITQGSLGGNGEMDGGVLLAQQMPDEFNPKGWYGSEKMDGVRAIWTGSKFYSRNGNEFYPPDFFIEKFPNCTLDGELFTKRDDFQRCVGIVKTKNGNKEKDDRWKEIVYLVYDCPKLNRPFKNRIQALQEQIPKLGSKYIKVLPHVLIQDNDHLQDQLEKTLKKDGEGIMLRDPNSQYEQRRSKTLLKVKTFTDEEATVIAHEKGEGRCANMMGAIVCRMKNGIEFKIGSGFDDSQRRKPPKIGSVITFKYQNLTKDKKPRFPIYLRQKEDE